MEFMALLRAVGLRKLKGCKARERDSVRLSVGRRRK